MQVEVVSLVVNQLRGYLIKVAISNDLLALANINMSVSLSQPTYLLHIDRYTVVYGVLQYNPSLVLLEVILHLFPNPHSLLRNSKANIH